MVCHTSFFFIRIRRLHTYFREKNTRAIKALPHSHAVGVERTETGRERYLSARSRAVVDAPPKADLISERARSTSTLSPNNVKMQFTNGNQGVVLGFSSFTYHLFLGSLENKRFAVAIRGRKEKRGRVLAGNTIYYRAACLLSHARARKHVRIAVWPSDGQTHIRTVLESWLERASDERERERCGGQRSHRTR